MGSSLPGPGTMTPPAPEGTRHALASPGSAIPGAPPFLNPDLLRSRGVGRPHTSPGGFLHLPSYSWPWATSCT